MKYVKRRFPADLSVLLQDSKVKVALSDNDAARDVARVCRALDKPVPCVVCGNSITVNAGDLEVVRAYLRGDISVENYRHRMPVDFFGYTGDIYHRQ